MSCLSLWGSRRSLGHKVLIFPFRNLQGQVWFHLPFPPCKWTQIFSKKYHKTQHPLRQNRAASFCKINAKKRNGGCVSLHLPWSTCCSPPVTKALAVALAGRSESWKPPGPSCVSVSISDHLSRSQPPWSEFCSSTCPGSASSACLSPPAWSSTW